MVKQCDASLEDDEKAAILEELNVAATAAAAKFSRM